MIDERRHPMSHEQALENAAAFVLGALTPDEEQAVRAHLATCDLPHDEFAELGGAVVALADSVEPVAPPPALKTRVLDAAAADLEARGLGAAERVPEPFTPPPPASAPTHDRVRPFPPADERAARRRGPGPVGWLVGLAAVIAVVALGAWNVNLQNELSGLRGDVGALQARLDASERFNLSVATVLDAASEPGSTTAILLPPEGGPGPRGLASVQADGTVQLAMRGLAPTAGTQVYETWVIAGSGAPVPVGSFQVAADGTAAVTLEDTPAEGGVTLALTLEPGPGATTPTLPIQSAGVVSGGTT